ncbi:MAG: Nramp family divalent metal transporter, partial [Phycisphaerales bacterium]
MAEESLQGGEMLIKKPPVGLAVFMLVGPSMVWAAEYIGSGEVIVATRTGAILGTTVLWALVAGVFLKFWIGMSGARYTVCTGEGMIDMFERMPGPKHWAVWIVLVGQFAAGAISIGALATSAGVFVNSLVPIGPRLGGWLVTFVAVGIVWSGAFSVLKIVMSFLVLIVVLGVLYVAGHVFPGFTEFLKSFSLNVPAVPGWALEK